MPNVLPRRLRALQEDGAALIDPPLAGALEVWKQNRLSAARSDYDCHGVPLEQLRHRAREELVAGAVTFTKQHRDVAFIPPVLADAPFILAGHQPELFHPGVWLKNYLLSTLGKQLRAFAINVIVDTDVIRSASIRVPVRHGEAAAVESVPFDAAGELVPFEERPVLDPRLFESFDQRVLAAYGTAWRPRDERDRPLLVDLWKAATTFLRAKGSDPRLGHLITRARHRLEWQLGLETLEVPLSYIAQTSKFRWFTAHLLAQLPRLQAIYNSALAEYRHANRIRSSTHPVPDLHQDGDWLEAPFFVWTVPDPRRRRVFVRQDGGAMILSDRQDLRLALRASPDQPLAAAVEQLHAAELRGIKLRPRALITTMYGRLVLSDLFIHGIGGAKYDELTDLIIRRFFGIEPPAYMTATATFRLPIARPNVAPDDVRLIARRIRDLRYRPESFLCDPRIQQDSHLAQQLSALAAEKREYLLRHDLRRCSQEVFDRFDRINRAMLDLLRPVEEELRADHAELIGQLKQSQLLGSREFSFVLFPAEDLPARLLDLSKLSA